MNWLGMNAASGRAISATDHIIQSVRDILITPVGSRLRALPRLRQRAVDFIDQPQHQTTRPRLMAATVQALINWEPRITITRVDVLGGGMDGALTVELTWQRKDAAARRVPEQRAPLLPFTGAAQ